MTSQDETGNAVTIIGAGIVGVCCAVWLQRAGCQVTLIDRGEPGSGTSFGNTAMITPGQVVPYSIPGLWRDVPKWLFSKRNTLKIRTGYIPVIAPWLWSLIRAGRVENAIAVSRAMRSLHQQAFPLYAELVKGTAAQDFFEKCGHIHLSLAGTKTRSPQLTRLMQEASGVAVEHLSFDDIRAMEPELAPIYKSGVLMPGNGRVRNPFRLVQILANEAIRGGARFISGDISRINMQGGQCVSVRVNEADIPVQKLVLAAGIGSKSLTDQLGFRIPLEAERGYHVTIKNPGVRPGRQLIVKDWGLGVGPIDNDLRVAGTVEFSGLKAKPDWRRADKLLARAKELFPSANFSEVSRWKGDRPSISDGLALLGRPQKFQNLYFAFGNGQHGMSAGPMMGKALCEIVTGQTPSIDISPFNPDRFN
jgi:D-amino-acid dehydrogenase